MKPKVKICGITNAEDGSLALRLGADELGFVLAPSPRRVEPEAAKAVIDALREIGSFRAIGVFVNEDAGAMRDILRFAGLDAAQIHGDESPEDCAGFNFPWYRALRVASVADAMAQVQRRWGCPRLLVDTLVGSSYGGTGTSVGTWAALASRAIAREQGKEFFIAGGVKPRNAASFIHSFAPDGIDISSGVEEKPGKKSEEKLRALFAAIRRATAEREEYGIAAR
jgi:Phosphoribosylanthranilate isomerase